MKKIPKYIGNIIIYFPEFKKIVKKGDLLPELPIEEAETRSDFIIYKEKEEIKNGNKE